MELAEYLRDPCAMLSIPWWKQRHMNVPSHLTILHHRDFTPEAAEGCHDQIYFRLYHDLHAIPEHLSAGFHLEECSPRDAALIAAIINHSYPDIRVTGAQIRAMESSPAFCSALWMLAREGSTGTAAGCAMGEFDPESGEMSIEWVQVLPRFRQRGIGLALVTALLARAPFGSRFATVSGRADNPANPEKLYRRCGFTGSDYWHILSKEN